MEKRQKLVGWNKGGLTEQQTKGTGTTTIQIRGIHKTKQQNAESHSHHPWLPGAPEPRETSCSPAPLPPDPGMTARGKEYPTLFGQVRSACPAVPLPGFW